MRRHSRRALTLPSRMVHRAAGRRGQNTVEYLLMLTVVVGVVLVAGVALKKFLPGLIENIKGMISGTGAALGNPAR